MKKLTVLIFVSVMLFGVISYTSALVPLPHPADEVNGDGDSGKETAIYQKIRDHCPNDDKKMEYSCHSNGDEQCKVQNCP